MSASAETLVDIAFDGAVIEWRGPAPFVFVAIPEDHAGEIRYAARTASYGWGCVPVQAEIDGIAFETALFPRDGSYVLPLKVAVRRRLDIAPGGTVRARLRIVTRP